MNKRRSQAGQISSPQGSLSNMQRLSCKGVDKQYDAQVLTKQKDAKCSKDTDELSPFALGMTGQESVSHIGDHRGEAGENPPNVSWNRMGRLSPVGHSAAVHEQHDSRDKSKEEPQHQELCPSLFRHTARRVAIAHSRPVPLIVTRSAARARQSSKPLHPPRLVVPVTSRLDQPLVCSRVVQSGTSTGTGLWISHLLFLFFWRNV